MNFARVDDVNPYSRPRTRTKVLPASRAVHLARLRFVDAKRAAVERDDRHSSWHSVHDAWYAVHDALDAWIAAEREARAEPLEVKVCSHCGQRPVHCTCYSLDPGGTV